jgi:hypothetical protein
LIGSGSARNAPTDVPRFNLVGSQTAYDEVAAIKERSRKHAAFRLETSKK